MRTVGANLQTHLDTGQTTLCFLLKIVPQVASSFGVTSLDIPVIYDDGGGEITYSAAIGMNQSALETSADLSVNNSEAMLLITSAFTKEDIAAGILDFATFFIYRVNWSDLSQGHYLVQSGTTGIVRSNNELSGVLELRGLPQQLKQSYIGLYSITCRASFGSLEGDEPFPCLFDFDSLWSDKTIATVDGDEPDRVFTVNSEPTANGPNGALGFDTAIIEMLTGNNAGLTVETETVSDVDISLRFASAYAIEVGDTLRIRPDCQKRYELDCIADYDNGVNFRGEPWIPLTEEAPAQFPGAQVSGIGAPPNEPDPAPYTPPNLEGSVPFETYFDPIGSRTNEVRDILIPISGLTLAVDIPDTGDSKILGFRAIAHVSTNANKHGSISDVVGKYNVVPNSSDIEAQGVSGGINQPQYAIDNPVFARDLVRDTTVFFNIVFTEDVDPDDAWIKLEFTWSDP